MWLKSQLVFLKSRKEILKVFAHVDGRFFPFLLPFLFILEGVILKLTVGLVEILFVFQLTL